MGFLFSRDGRISRKTYIIWSLVLTFFCYASAFTVGFFAGFAGMSDSSAGTLGAFIGVAYTVMQVFLIIRRLHDIGKPGTHCWLFLVPFYNLYLSLVLTFTRGNEGDNAYGTDPAVA
jgi:uncharacterized membrane protein YhaH (DUF805 family)